MRTIGVDEHVWRPSRIGDSHRAATAMVDLTRDEHGCLHARLLDVVPGRSGHAYAGWLQAQTETFIAGIEHAALDRFRGYANALRDQLPDAVAVLDAFHVVKLGTQVVDEVRRRMQQETLGRREAFRTRPVDAGPYTFVAADALVLTVREGGRVVNVHALVTVGVNADGHREILGVEVSSAEDGAGWLTFFRGLTARGLSGVRLVTSDAHRGLVEAIGATLPGAENGSLIWPHRGGPA